MTHGNRNKLMGGGATVLLLAGLYLWGLSAGGGGTTAHITDPALNSFQQQLDTQAAALADFAKTGNVAALQAAADAAPPPAPAAPSGAASQASNQDPQK